MDTTLVTQWGASAAASTLPLLVPRSAVYWPRRNTTSLSGEPFPAELAVLPPEERAAVLLTAVACVLFRYGPRREVHVGLCTADGSVRRIAVVLDAEAPLGAARSAIVRLLADPPAAVTAVEEQHSVNPDFSVLVDVSDGPEPDLRQEVTLALKMAESALACRYHSRLFDEATARRFLGHVVTFVRALVGDPACPLGSLAYVLPDERDEILAVSCRPAASPAPEGTLQGLFAAAVLTFPGRTAVEFADRALTYRDLNALTRRIAANLVAAGAHPGGRVGVLVRPGVEQVATLIAVLHLGAVPVPLDHTFPQSRLLSIGRAAGITALAAERSLADKAAGFGVALLVLEDLADLSHAGACRGSADDLVYLLFTSGSTGTPKGVRMTQRTLVNLVKWQDGRDGPEVRRTLNRSSMAFDVGFQEIFSTLCFGGTLVIASEADRADIAALRDLIAARRVTHVFVPPVALVQLAELFDDRTTDFSALRQVNVSGDRLKITPAIVRMFRACTARVANQYGPTETHVATCYDLPGASVRWPLQPPIGLPIDHARVMILDPGGHLCPIGVPGEIAIGGVLPAAGYANDPDGTARRFVPDRFPGAEPDGRLYLTGDVGRLSPAGQFEFLGRADDQVKLRGYRIELGDIEAHAMAVDGVSLAAAILRERGQDKDQYLALYVEAQPGRTIEPLALRSALAETLPQHMVPALGAISILDVLPLNRNGKVARARLPLFADRDTGAVEAEDGSLPRRIAAIWKRHLHLDQVGEDQDFTVLGGHSLLAIQIVSSVNDTFDVSVPVATLLRGGTLAQFSEKVSRMLDAKAGMPSPLAPDRAAAAAALARVKLPDGTSVDAPYHAEALHFFHEVEQRRVYLRAGIMLPARATVVDVGANIGLFTRFVLRHAREARVLAVEPAPILIEALHRNLAEFRDAVTIAGCGLSDRDGLETLTYYPRLTGMSSFVPDAAEDRRLLTRLIDRERASDPAVEAALAEAGDALLDSRLASQAVQVPTNRLSTLIRPLAAETIDLVKIDVQRGEDMVLDGIDDADWRRIRQLVVEHQTDGRSGGGIASRLEARGYRVTTEQDAMHYGTGVVYTYAVRPS